MQLPKVNPNHSDSPQTPLKKRSRFVAWFLKHKKATIPVTLILLAGIAYTAVFFLFINQPPEESKPAKPEPAKLEEVVEEPKFYSPLTGSQVPEEADTTKPVTAVILENTPAARPQSGLQEAELVYEAITEGGITRFLALYQQNKPELIGPVRSLRPFFIDWLAPYNASILHVGGSAEALTEIRNGNYRDLDQFFHAGTYWRSTDRYAPHNVYTNSSNVDNLNTSLGYTSSDPAPLPRTEEAPTESDDTSVANTVTVNMSGHLYNSSWHYEPTTGQYNRAQAGAAHTDRERGQVSAEVVVVLNQTFQAIEGGRYAYGTTGSGQGYVFYKGKATPINWHKQDRISQFTFTDSSGVEYKLPQGTTWISIVPNQQGAPTWQ